MNLYCFDSCANFSTQILVKYMNHAFQSVFKSFNHSTNWKTLSVKNQNDQFSIFLVCRWLPLDVSCICFHNFCYLWPANHSPFLICMHIASTCRYTSMNMIYFMIFFLHSVRVPSPKLFFLKGSVQFNKSFVRCNRR